MTMWIEIRIRLDPKFFGLVRFRLIADSEPDRWGGILEYSRKGGSKRVKHHLSGKSAF